MASEEKKPPASLDAFFKSKPKKTPKATNMNAFVERPVEKTPPPKPVRSTEGENTEGWERALRHDQEILKAGGLWIKEVEADGACLFRAFADQLTGDGSVHADYRTKCVDFLESHREDFEPFLDEDFTAYCARMRLQATWGGHVEVQALARSLGVNVVIYTPAEAVKVDALSSTAIEIVTSEDARCVLLSFHPTHHAGQHYNSVRCVTDVGEGAADHMTILELKRRKGEALLPPPAVPAPEAAEQKTKGRSAKVFHS